jgi:2-dehydro-3-deoxyglucarate aldolase
VNNLKEKLKQNQQTIGSWITLAHPAIAEIMAKAGFDWLAVDLEHSVITIREAEELIRVINLCHCAPLVRLTANDQNQIKRVMDAGAAGIIVPMVNSQADAQKAVEATYYPPQGKRGVGLARAQGYGARFKEYCDWLGNEATVIVQIEHIDAVNDIENILSTPGVDGYILGPYDLSGSMNLIGQTSHPEVEKAINKVNQTGKALGKPGGIHVVEPIETELQQRIEQGFKFIAYSLDTRIIDVSCRSALNAIKQ